MPHKRAKLATRIEDKKKQGFNLAPTPSSKYNDTPRSASRILNSSHVQANFRASGRVTSEDTGERQRRPKNKGKRKAEEGEGEGDVGLSTKKVKRDEVASTSQKSQVLPKDLGKGKGKDVRNGDGKAKTREKKDHGLEIRPNETLGEFNRRVETHLRPGVTSAIKSASLKTQPKSKSTTQSPLTADLDKLSIPSRPIKTFAPIPAPRRLNDIVQAPPVLPHMKRSGARKEASGSVWGVTGRTPLSAAEVRILSGERERVVKAYRELKKGREEGGVGAGEGGDRNGGDEGQGGV